MADDFTSFETPPLFNDNGVSLVMGMIGKSWLFSELSFYIIGAKCLYTRLLLNLAPTSLFLPLLNLTISY